MPIERNDGPDSIINFGGAGHFHAPIDEYHVGAFYPEAGGRGKPTAVLLEIPLPQGMPGTFYLRFKSYRAVREHCQAMLAEARRVWPEHARPVERF